MPKCPVITEDWEALAKKAGFQPEVIAAYCHISLRQLERRFKKQFNQTPISWTRGLRRRLAIQHLAQGWSTKAVAEDLRFWDSAHLCHEFKKAYGTTPQNFGPQLRGLPDRDRLPQALRS